MEKIEKPTNLIEYNQNVLIELFQELEQITQKQYVKHAVGFSYVGAHVRHILDFYTILTKSVFGNTIINFDNRSDNYILANNHQYGLQSIQLMINQLNELKKISLKDLFLQQTLDYQEEKTLQDLLHQVLVHTEHHCALILFLIMVMDLDHIFVNPYFGYSRASKLKIK